MNNPIISVRLRTMPYPFKAGLAICSDIDECDLETFIKVHRYINSEKHGLGLPMADSFFGVARRRDHLAYFNPDGTTRPEEAEFIQNSIKDGLIDSLHSWGDFNDGPPEPHFLQTVAEDLTNDLIKAGLQVPVWINHGSPNNHQNLFARLWPEYQGDNPESPLYTVPYIKELGMKYYWWSEIVGWPLSTSNPENSNGKQLRRLATNTIKNVAKTFLGKSDRTRSSEQITRLTNEVVFNDGNSMVAFTRFARHPDRSKLWGPTRNSLRYSLSRDTLDELVQDEGYMIVYTHLAKPAPTISDEMLFPFEDEEALKLLADYYNKKLIWVAPTSKLLQFKMIYDYLDWRVVENGERIVIGIENVNDPVTGPRVPDIKELAGINFYSPIPENTVIKLAGKNIQTKILATDIQKGGWVGFDVAPPPKTGLVDD